MSKLPTALVLASAQIRQCFAELVIWPGRPTYWSIGRRRVTAPAAVILRCLAPRHQTL